MTFLLLLILYVIASDMIEILLQIDVGFVVP